MKRFSLVATVAVLLIGLPGIASAACTMDNTDGDSTNTTNCTSGQGNDLENIRRDVDLQASAGVGLYAKDGSGSEVQVASCHDSGSAGYHGDTDGGSVQEVGAYDAGSDCANDMSGDLYTTITSAS